MEVENFYLNDESVSFVEFRKVQPRTLSCQNLENLLGLTVLTIPANYDWDT